ncbi:hypothetical protein [Mesorhizobium caraganae]|uniref:hypothetical protein n=1 Tax=Mesorhizobium caraganae TaxID=483206 RepID=UPI003336D8CD
MTIARKILSSGAAGALATMIAACTTGGPDGPPIGSQPRGVEGSWLNAEGKAVSTLNGGVFTTVSAETGEKFADGSYTKTGATSVEINGTSLIRQQPIAFNCLLVSINQLNCTSSAGQNFVLTRRS